MCISPASPLDLPGISLDLPWISQGFHLFEPFSFQLDYPLMNSWMIGRDVNQPGPFAKRFGRFEHAERAALFPAVNVPPCAEPHPDPRSSCNHICNHICNPICNHICNHICNRICNHI